MNNLIFKFARQSRHSVSYSRAFLASAVLFCAFLFYPAFALCAEQGGLAITEFMPNPKSVADSKGEWIEVTNLSGSEVCLDGWKINDGDNETNHGISGSFSIPAGQSAVICKNGNFSENGGIFCHYTSSISLGQTFEGQREIALKDPFLSRVHSVYYSAEDVGDGKSIIVGVDGNLSDEQSVRYGLGDYGSPAGNKISIEGVFYPSIQYAISVASYGDEINIPSGSFYEDIEISNSVSILGQGHEYTYIYGSALITSSDVLISGLNFSPSGGLSAISIDSSNSEISGTKIEECDFNIGEGSVGVYFGGDNPAYSVSSTIIENSNFYGPESKNCEVVKIGSNAGVGVLDFDFLGNLVDSCSISINLNDENLSGIKFRSNLFTNTAGAVFIGIEEGGFGVISGFEFSDNSVDSTNLYGLKIGDEDGCVFQENNFGEGNKIFDNSFLLSNEVAQCGAICFFSSSSVNLLDVENNWWGDASGPSQESNPQGKGSLVVGNLDFVPWYSDDSKSYLYDGHKVRLVDGSGSSGRAELPDGEHSISLSDDIFFDFSNYISSSSGGRISVSGEDLDLSNFTSGNLFGEDLLSGKKIGDVNIVVGKAVKLLSGSPGSPITLTNSSPTSVLVVADIPDGAVIMAPDGWTGDFMPPKSAASSGGVPDGFKIGNNAFEVGNSDVTLLFDKPVKIKFSGITGDMAYKPSGSSEWHRITSKCSGPDDASNISFPGECSIEQGSDTIIWTYHFTSFSSISSVSPPSSSSRASSFSGSVFIPMFPDNPKITINNGNISTTSHSVTLSLSAENMKQGFDGALMRISNKADFIGSDWVKFTEKIQWNLEEGYGKKRVWAQFQNSQGTSLAVSDSIDVFSDKDMCQSEQDEDSSHDKFYKNSVDLHEGIHATAVLGAKEYPQGSLIRGSDKKIYVIIGLSRKHIASLSELREKYLGKEILNVNDEEITLYPLIAQDKKYPNGQLIRGSDKKVYVLESPKKRHIKSLEELTAAYFGKPIIDISDSELDEY